MAEVTSFTADRLQAMEDAGIADADFDGSGNLILTRNDATQINAGGVSGIPAGAVQMFAGSVVPTGWLLCNGQLVSRTTYAALFTAIGTTYGAGDGSTTFALPNMAARFPRMDVSNLGVAGGSSAAHSHTVAAHTHTIADHSHDLQNGSPVGHARIQLIQATSGRMGRGKMITVPSWNATVDIHASTADADTSAGTEGAELVGSTATSPTTPGTNGNATDAAGGTLPPYLNLNFVIKT